MKVVQGSKEKSGNRLKDLRAADGLSQPALADALGMGIKKQNISAWERDGIPIDNAFLIADYFGVTLDYLYGRSDTRNGEAAETEAYTGLSSRAASKLHWVYEDDKVRRQFNAETVNMSSVISRIIIASAGRLNTDVQSLAVCSKKTIESYKPFYAMGGKNKSDRPLQRNNLVNGKKTLIGAVGYCEILSGERLLRYKVQRIADRLAAIIADACGVTDAIRHCRKIDAEQREIDDRLLEELERRMSDGE